MEPTLQTIIFGTVSSLLAVFLLTTKNKVSIWRKMRSLNGEYRGYNLDGSSLSLSPVFIAEYKFWLKKLILFQKSDQRGNWRSEFHIISEIPHNATGIFKYDESGKYGDQWGVHDVTINFDEQIFHIKAHSKGHGRTVEYVLKKD